MAMTTATFISRKPSIWPHAFRERGVEIEQLIFPDDVHDFLLHRHCWRHTVLPAIFRPPFQEF